MNVFIIDLGIIDKLYAMLKDPHPLVSKYLIQHITLMIDRVYMSINFAFARLLYLRLFLIAL